MANHDRSLVVVLVQWIITRQRATQIFLFGLLVEYHTQYREPLGVVAHPLYEEPDQMAGMARGLMAENRE